MAIGQHDLWPSLGGHPQDRSLSQRQLAALIRRSNQSVSHWETARGSLLVDPVDVVNCARVLRCCRQDLLASLDEPLPPCPLHWPRIRWQLIRRSRQLAGKRAGLVSQIGMPLAGLSNPRGRPTPSPTMRASFISALILSMVF